MTKLVATLVMLWFFAVASLANTGVILNFDGRVMPKTLNIGSPITDSQVNQDGFTFQKVVQRLTLPLGAEAGQLTIELPGTESGTYLAVAAVNGVPAFAGERDLSLGVSSLLVSLPQISAGGTVDVEMLLKVREGAYFQKSGDMMTRYGQEYWSVIGAGVTMASAVAPSCPPQIFGGLPEICRGYSINGVYGTPLVKGVGALGFIGNSQIVGQGDWQVQSIGSFAGMGRLAEELGLPYITLGVNGSKHASREALFGPLTRDSFKKAGVTVAGVLDGHNLLRDGYEGSPAQRADKVKADLIDLADSLEGIGVKTIASTISPIVGWAANGTNNSEVLQAQTEVNNWLLGGGFTGANRAFFDGAGAVSNLGTWNAGMTVDGIHLSSKGYNEYIAAAKPVFTQALAGANAPEPGSIVLVAVGLLLLALRRKK